MSTLALNSENDLYFTKNRLTILTGANTNQEILQRIKIRLKFFKDEWFLNSEHGLPYFENILGTKNIDLNILESIFREQLLDIEGVKSVIESSVDYNASNRRILYAFSIASVSNTVILNNFIVL